MVSSSEMTQAGSQERDKGTPRNSDRGKEKVQREEGKLQLGL